jgi:VanZ family protein
VVKTSAGGRWRRCAWLVWLAVIFVFAVIPLAWLFHREPSLNPSFVTTAGHAGEYAVLAALAEWAFLLRTSAWRAALAGVLVAAIYGPLMEVVQLPLPYRALDVHDMVADWLGALAGALVVGAVCWLAAKKAERAE